MALTYADALQYPVSGKRVFASQYFLKRMFDWTLSGGLYYGPLVDELRMQSMTEREPDGDAVEMQEAASTAALLALDTSTVGGWYWDFAAELVWVKAKSGSTPFQNKYVASVNYPVSVYGGELDGEAHDPCLSRAPSTTQQGGEILDGRVARIGAGSTVLRNTDALIIEQGLEPDGQIVVQRVLEVLK